MIANEIVPATRSGGANTSHTIVATALVQLLGRVDREADSAAYERAVLEENVLGKSTVGSRRRTLRYLRELYLLRPDSILFRALRDLWEDDPAGQPLLAGLCALARDAVFRASAPAVLQMEPGDRVTAQISPPQSRRYSPLRTARPRSRRSDATPSRPGSRPATFRP